MSKKFLNDSQMEKAHGAGVYSYIEGSLKITAGAALAAVSTAILAKGHITGLSAEKIFSFGQKDFESNAQGGIGLAIGLGFVASGINEILDEHRMRKLEKNK